MNKNSMHFYFSLLFTGFMIIVTAASAVFFGISYHSRLSGFRNDAVEQLDIQKRLFLSHFQIVCSDLMFLSRSNETDRFKETGSEEDRLLLQKEFYSYMECRNIYDQLRYIDSTGMETVRINFYNGEPAVVDTADLQDKSSRYYYTETIRQPAGRIYISPFDLNIENSRIEQPLKPMLRFGSPVYNSSGSIAGIIVLNYLGSTVIDDLVSSTAIYPGRFSLLNSDGFWLYDDNPDTEWGFMYPEKSGLTMAQTDPGLWDGISNSDIFQITTGHELVTAVRVSPFLDKRAAGNKNCYYLVNTITKDEMDLGFRQILKNILRILLISAAVITLLSLFLARTIIDRNRYRTELKNSALFDQLTGLPNRKLLDERGDFAAKHSFRYHHNFAVFFLDLDGFKEINDTWGHNIGDQALVETGEILKNSIRETDTAARFGGDEFIILLPHITSISDCRLIAEKILALFSAELMIEGRKVKLGVSIGIAAVSPDSGSDFHEAMKAADMVMYDVKKSGKNSYRITEI